MIAECARCGDPLFPYMERCNGCGTDNPSFQNTAPPRNEVYTSDEGTEWGLFAIGLGGLIACARLLSPTRDQPAWQLGLAAVCALSGVAMLVGFKRLDVSALSPGSKTALRIAMGVAGAVFAWAAVLAR